LTCFEEPQIIDVLGEHPLLQSGFERPRVRHWRQREPHHAGDRRRRRLAMKLSTCLPYAVRAGRLPHVPVTRHVSARSSPPHTREDLQFVSTRRPVGGELMCDAMTCRWRCLRSPHR
jgi:hypothetical protein